MACFILHHQERPSIESCLIEALGISLGPVSNICLGSAVSGLLCLNNGIKIWVQPCQQHLEIFRESRNNFLKRFIIRDETWIYRSDLKLRYDPAEWCGPKIVFRNWLRRCFLWFVTNFVCGLHWNWQNNKLIIKDQKTQ